MDASSPLTCHERTVLLLREVDPDLAEVVNAVQADSNGEVLVGLLGWLPLPERMRLGRAVYLVHMGDSCEHDPKPSAQIAKEVAAENAAWRNPLSEECRKRRDAGIRTWTALGHPAPRLNAD